MNWSRERKRRHLQIFLEQYKDFLVIILIIAAVASGFMGDVRVPQLS